ncbi:ABC transporter substrate-binding protein [Pseudoroseomonas wenyumeiae]
MSIPRRSFLFMGLSLALVLGPLAPLAAQPAADPAAQPVEQLHAALLQAMQQAQSLGVEGRAKLLTAPVEQAFDLPGMARTAVGARWSGFTPEEQKAVAEAFRRYTIASYARNFSGFSGQSFTTNRVEPQGEDKVVITTLNNPGGAPVNLTYRLRQTGGVWKIIDVLHDSISELAIRRSEFSGAVRQGGAGLLVQRLNEQSDRLMRP